MLRSRDWLFGLHSRDPTGHLTGYLVQQPQHCDRGDCAHDIRSQVGRCLLSSFVNLCDLVVRKIYVASRDVSPNPTSSLGRGDGYRTR